MDTNQDITRCSKCDQPTVWSGGRCNWCGHHPDDAKIEGKPLTVAEAIHAHHFANEHRASSRSCPCATCTAPIDWSDLDAAFAAAVTRLEQK